jgi:hypothetical protein
MAITINGSTGISGVPAGGYNLVDGDMPSGAVLQVVQSIFTTEVATTTTSWADTGMSASITPSNASNKVLVQINHGLLATANCYGRIQLLRGSTSLEIYGYAQYSYPSELSAGYLSAQWLDSPSTTSATTYKTQLALHTGSGTFKVNNGDSGGYQVSSIILMEIAA